MLKYVVSPDGKGKPLACKYVGNSTLVGLLISMLEKAKNPGGLPNWG